MKAAKKITVDVPEQLLIEAQEQTGLGISETVRLGLKLLAASKAYKDLLKLQGKVKFSLNWRQMKQDRE